jgi:hypothetical protein
MTGPARIRGHGARKPVCGAKTGGAYIKTRLMTPKAGLMTPKTGPMTLKNAELFSVSNAAGGG